MKDLNWKHVKIMYAVNVFAAGVPGLLILMMPEFAERNLLWETQDIGTMKILGSIWFSIGLVSLFGWFNPRPYVGVFVIQFFYKAIWLLTYFIPAALTSDIPSISTWIIAGIFMALILAVIFFLKPINLKNYLTHGN